MKLSCETNFVVLYRDSPTKITTLILITHITNYIEESELLDWYAAKYAIDRSKLSGYFLDSIEYKE